MKLKLLSKFSLSHLICRHSFSQRQFVFSYIFHNQILYALLALSLAACTPTKLERFKGTTHESCGFRATNSQRISWKDNLPITMYLHESFPSEYRESVERAMKAWEQGLNRSLFILSTESVSGALPPQHDGTSVIYWVSTWDEKSEKNQANTDVWVRDNESKIIEADISVNASMKNFSFYTDTPTSDKQVHLESLLIHELGHVLGLVHNESAASVMKSTLPFSEERVEIHSTDIENMKCEY